jgi:hypothetical protein
MSELQRLALRIKEAHAEHKGLHLHPYEVQLLAEYLDRMAVLVRKLWHARRRP